MELADRICVVAGGASGIGRGRCRRSAAEGARAVVVVDKDADGALATAEALGSRGTALTADVTVEADVEAVVERSEAPDTVGESVWSVNVLAHLYAARAMIPLMLERGGGYLLSTASAAGLLSQPGDAPYSVTKHAAVALSAWLA